jgi:hypothetical protein
MDHQIVPNWWRNLKFIQNLEQFDDDLVSIKNNAKTSGDQ